MIIGLGIDLAELDRVANVWEKFGNHFARKVLTAREMEALTPVNAVRHLAALWAGKEAAVKALGTGYANGVTPQCVEILHLPSGKPELSFLGRGFEISRELGVKSSHVSLTHSRDTAAAVVVLEN